jgi:parallel beta-helix repeat protein
VAHCPGNPGSAGEPRTISAFRGSNDHVLEFNEVYRVCTETGDAGAFYIGRDWSQRGSIVRYNYFHDIGTTLQDNRSFTAIMGVYLDDQASGITVFGNIFSRVNMGVLLGGGRDNRLENNIFAFCDRANPGAMWLRAISV